MSQQQNEEMPTLEGNMASFPATILEMLNIESPDYLPPSIQPMVNFLKKKGKIDRIISVIIDNFGLFEITYYKPKFLISNSDALVLLSTKNPYTLGTLHQMLYGDFKYEKNGFNLFKYLKDHNKSSVFIGRERDVDRYAKGFGISKPNDMGTWIEAAKVINRQDVSMLHYLDFEEIYRNKIRTGASTPEELIKKLIKRTDKWILSSWKMLRHRSLMLIIGNHGRYKIDLNYQGKLAEWRSASVPLALLMYKE